MLKNIKYINGLYIANNWLNENLKNSLKRLVLDKIKFFPDSNFRLYEENFTNTKIKSAEFNFLINRFVDEITKNDNLNINLNDCYKVMRVINGTKTKKQSHLYHFDAHKLTILIPIIIPNNKSNKNGDLVIIPEVRKTHNNIVINIIQKIFFQNKFTSFLIKNNFLKIFYKTYKINLKPGNLYAFKGFNTLHGNEDIESFSTRATLLIHFDDVFSNSKLIKLNRNLYKKKEIKNTTKLKEKI